MNLPSPAIVPQAAVRRLPRAALLLLCAAYVLPGFWARDPWRNADLRAYGYMWELAHGQADWLAPALNQTLMATDGVLPYWLGALFLKLAQALDLPTGWHDDVARVPFALLAALALSATWYAVYTLARFPRAQPVQFAFGGEASPKDYARAVADGGVLALLACLGMAQLAHEATATTAQLAFSAWAFLASAALLRGRALAGPLLVLSLSALAVSGAPSLALVLAAGIAVVIALADLRPLNRFEAVAEATSEPAEPAARSTMWVWVGVSAGMALALATLSGQWQWRVQPLPTEWNEVKGLGRLLLWFTWPAWPLLVWTLWRWRRQWRSPHLALPGMLLLIMLGATVTVAGADRSLLLGLPAFAALASFALPTLQRSVSALIDWFTLLFFSACVIVIWVVWLSMQTGVPAQPAANVARLAPGFVPTLSWPATVLALAATLAWIGLVRWRVGRHRAALWKSLVLPAGGATLAWLLLMTLWLPLLDHARSADVLVRHVAQAMRSQPGCAAVLADNPSLIAGLRTRAGVALDVQPMSHVLHPLPGPQSRCPWLVLDGRLLTPELAGPWVLHARVPGSTRTDHVLLYRQAATGTP